MEIRLVQAESERQAVYRFRYKIYVQRMGRTQLYVDHERGTVHEPLDEHGRILGAFIGGRLVGTLRTNLLSEGSLGFYEKLYGIDTLAEVDQQRVSITTKLMVDPAYSGAALSMRLSMLTYRLALESGVEWDYLDGNDHMIPFFERMGHQVIGDEIEHPEYGSVTLMRLTLRDGEHLRRVRSPFVSILNTQLIS